MSDRRAGRRYRRPAATPEGREGQLISYAMDLAERQLREGNASAQVVTHFLKAGSTRERLEQARLENENLLISAKIEAMASSQRMEELYESAISAMRIYNGQEEEYSDEDDDDYY